MNLIWHYLECNTNVAEENVCYSIDGEMSIFFSSNSCSSSRKLQKKKRDISQLNEKVKQIMESGQLNDAHPAIILVTFMDKIGDPLIFFRPPDDETIAAVSSSSTWWVIILILAGLGLLLAFALLVWRKQKDQEGEDYDAESESSQMGRTDNMRLLPSQY